MTTELPVADSRQVRRSFTALMGTQRRRVTAAIVLHIAAAGAATAAPLLMGRMIDELNAGAEVAQIDALALGMAAAVAAAIVLTWSASFVVNQVGELLSAKMRENFVARCLRLPLHTAEQAGQGDLMTRSTVDVPEAGALIRDTAPGAATAILTALVYVGAMIWVSPVLALCVLFAVPAIAVGARWYLKRARAAYLTERRAESSSGDALAATSDGARTTELFGLADDRRQIGDAAISRHWSATRRTLYLRSIYFLTLESSYVLPTASILLLGGALYFNGTVSIGEVATCAVLSRQVMTPMNFLLMMVERAQRGFASLARVEGVAEADTADDAPPTQPTGGTVELADVRFAYPTGGDVLHGVDLTVAAGERLAVVGPSGAGKSTLARLIAGVDEPRTGTVAFGTVAVGELPLDVRRQHIALVTQEHHVFAVTLRANLALARTGATDADLQAALDAVGAAWARQLPDGLDTEFGGAGRELDAASAQQIALARIILADPDVVILDEATAMLDPRAARDTEQALAAVLEGRTVIAIAHRLHTAHDADRIAVVEEGRVTELGSHDDLLERDGAYASLWRSWHGETAPAQALTDCRLSEGYFTLG